MDLCQKKSRNSRPHEKATGKGDYWIWTAIALPSRLRVTSYLSQERSEEAAQAFIQQFKARTDGRAPFFTSDKLPSYVAALVANYSPSHCLLSGVLAAPANSPSASWTHSCAMPKSTSGDGADGW